MTQVLTLGIMRMPYDREHDVSILLCEAGTYITIPERLSEDELIKQLNKKVSTDTLAKLVGKWKSVPNLLRDETARGHPILFFNPNGMVQNRGRLKVYS